MPSIFDPAIQAISGSLKQIAIDDIMRDYAHASRLFVDSNYRLLPKQGFLYHVFLDIDPDLGNLSMINRNSLSEIGLMAKQADLPKFNIETKTYNSYNRPNIVQSKIKFENLTIQFHDDSANVVRNFWYDYYRYYYRDSDHSNATYTQEYKYRPQTTGNFGFTRRSDTFKPYLRSVRIYSLHQKRFSEYILLNPIIKSFRHGQHQASGDANMLQHDMVIEYENVLYSDGSVTFGNPPGFADLHYDGRASPLVTAGGTHRVFGPGGLVDMSQSILTDINEQDYLSAIFKTARAANTARNMNVKRAAISELNGFIEQTAGEVINDSINQYMRQNNGTGYTVPTLSGVDGLVSSQYTGIRNSGSLPYVGSGGTRSQRRPAQNVQARSVPALTNVNTRLPANPGAVVPEQIGSDLNLINNQPGLRPTGVQGRTVSAFAAANESQRLVNIYQQQVTETSAQVYTTQQQGQALNNQLSNLNSRLTSAESATPPMVPPPGFNLTEWQNNKNAVVADLRGQISLTNNKIAQNQTDYAKQSQQLAEQNQQLNDAVRNQRFVG